MWIQQIELSNFKAYQNQIFSFPKPENGRNMVLIGGMNGHGKTTLLEAVYLCLYGEDATHHLARAGLKENAYAKFLQGALHGSNSIKRPDSMRVSIRLMCQDDYGYDVQRNWYFDPRGNYNDQEERLYEVRNGVQRPMDASEHLANVLNLHVVPAHLAPFFFFDGEEVKKLADNDRNEWVKQGMESLMGVVLVRQLKERLIQYQNNRRQGTSAVDRADLDKMHADIRSKITEREDYQHKLSECFDLLKKKAEEQEQLQQRLITIGAGGGNVKSVSDIIQEEGERKKELEDCEKNLEQLLANRLAFHLASPSLHEALSESLRAERVLIEWNDKKQKLEPEKIRFSSKFMENNRLDHFSKTEKSGLEIALHESWESLFWPRPDGCAENVLHDYLEPRQRQRLEEAHALIHVGAVQIREQVKRKETLVARLKELSNKRIQLQGVEDDGALQKLNDELISVQADLNSLSRSQGDLERQIKSIDELINNANATYERENNKFLLSEPAQSVAKKSARAISLIDDLIPRLFEQKIHELSEKVTKRFKSLAHRQWIDRIELAPDGAAQVYGKNNQLVKFDRSAGENQIFATALFAGLADVSGYHIPLIVDTPMARLDSQHRRNLLKFWHADPDRQVILLSQDKEVDSDLAHALQPYLSKTYLLESTKIGDGAYRTTAKENAYFEVSHDQV
jgi:DNA sulfur modification protein DndD